MLPSPRSTRAAPENAVIAENMRMSTALTPTIALSMPPKPDVTWSPTARATPASGALRYFTDTSEA